MEEFIFNFNDKEALSLQCESTCQDLYDDFFERLSRQSDFVGLDRFALLKDAFQVKWLPVYGCAVLYRQTNLNKSALWVVGVDGWTCHIHAWTGGRQVVSLGDVTTPFVRNFGLVETTAMPHVLDAFNRSLVATHSHRDEHKNHKTPSFAAGILWSTLQKQGYTANKLQPHAHLGGTTDVGRHTGCMPKNTSFPLVLCVVKVMLDISGVLRSNKLLEKAVPVYYMSFLVEIVAGIRYHIPREIDRAITVIREIEKWMDCFEEERFKVRVVQKIEEQHQKLRKLESPIPVESRSLSCDPLDDTLSRLRTPTFPDIPTYGNAHADQQSKLLQAKADEKNNLAWFDLESPSASGKEQDTWLVLAQLNTEFWDMAMELNNPDADRRDIKHLVERLGTLSQSTRYALTFAGKSPHIMSVELTSCELLAVWICYCWAHRDVKKKHQVFQDYSAALDPAELRHLVLRDKRAIDALRVVQCFLKYHRRIPEFPFRDQAATLSLAGEFGRNSKRLRDIYQWELKEANRRIDVRYQGICKKQEELRELDKQLPIALAELQAAEAASRISSNRDYTINIHGGRVYTAAYRSVKQHENQCMSNVSSIRKRISALEVEPKNEFFPLPEDEGTALTWLFFLYMPQEFCCLLDLIHLGQSKLWRNVPDGSKPPNDLVSWYIEHKIGPKDLSSTRHLSLGSHSQRVTKLATPDIRDYGRRTGVFFPDSYSRTPFWCGTDPFSPCRSENDTVLLFTEQLAGKENAQIMQQFLPMLPCPERGNLGVSLRNKKPTWLKHEEYLTYASLRAFPNGQIRQLLASLSDDLLPFQDSRVNVLVKQLLYHVGELSWKTDLTTEAGLDQIAKQMEIHADVLKESPKNCDKLVLLGNICCFFGQYSERLLNCASQFSDIAQRFGDDVSREAIGCERLPPRLQWKQAKFYGFALLCYSLGECDKTACLAMAELIVLYRSKFLFAIDVEESNSLESPIMQMMASRITDIVDCLSKNKPHLTHCLRQVIDDVPDGLEWSSVQYSGTTETGCFHALSDHLYSVNILNGTVLVDGIPPGLLPHSITNDPLYKRTFHERNFEVAVIQNGHYQSLKRIDKLYKYEFIREGGILHIIERDMSCRMEPESLVLLRREYLDLPTILCQGYSHWYSESCDCVLLRQPVYKYRRVEYLVTRESTFVIPYQSQALSAIDILDQKSAFDSLLLGTPTLSRLFHRIEKSEFIHLVRNPESTALRFSLPRYKLDFEQTKKGVTSLTFKHFSLETDQVFKDTLQGVVSYLILTHQDGRRIVLIPSGSISDAANVAIPHEWHTPRNYHVYDVHARFGYLEARETVGRLQLAGLYAASSSSLAEERSCKTGAYVATKLVRQCWTNEPMSSAVEQKLTEISKLSNLCCSLRLICSYLWKSANAVRFLHTDDELQHYSDLETDPLALDEYKQDKYAPRLLAPEEASLFGAQYLIPTPACLNDGGVRTVYKFVQDVESTLQEKCLRKERSARNDPFPLGVPANASGIEKITYDDLQSNWDAFCALERWHVVFDGVLCSELLQKTSAWRDHLEATILDSLESSHSTSEKLSKLSGKIPRTSALDLLSMVADESFIQKFHPAVVDSKDLMDIRLGITDWLCLCVLEDKLQRMSRNCRAQHALKEELRSVRNWNHLKHPKWLAFEVERQLQIRPYQYSIVQQLIDDPGHVIQLNMGLGKTSVLVPMIILELSQPGAPAVRVNLLASIINVVADDYRKTLGASVQHVKIFTMPFNRDVKLEESHASLLNDEIQFCKDCGGCLIVTPQHRNSLLLKQFDRDVFVSGFEDSNFLDLIDESDAILDTSFQLVYAIGDQISLPDGQTRWTVIETLLTVLVRTDNYEIQGIMTDSTLVHHEVCSVGAFPKVRFLSSLKNKHVKTLSKALCEALIQSPPYELIWMKKLPTDVSATLVKIISDADIGDAIEVIRSHPLLWKRESDILIARGCIASGLLFHGLRSRHRVDYGVGDSGKKSAVPFTASDTPKLRAEYSHPDMCILYTCLSYFHDGLTREQFLEAIVCLQNLGPSAQSNIYHGWIESIKEGVDANDLEKYDNVDKVDIDNLKQQDLMYNALKASMEVISFWMNNFVFVDETYQFPERRVTSAWNLVESGRAIGFSGTDDNRFLLPRGIRQIAPKEPTLCATNGEMIDRILKCTTDLYVLDEEETVALWETLLRKCIAVQADVLVDVGGLMAGVQNASAAIFLISKGLPEDFRGVVYFDTESGAWIVYERVNKRHIALKSSSLEEKECFVYFDQSRCRGSDMRLDPKASAVVTLEPNLTKDKFMQGCARMRSLHPDGQSLIILGTSEALSGDSTVIDVLERIISNTVESNKKGVIEWFNRGMDHAQFPKPVPLEVSLESMYAKPISRHESLSSFVEERVTHLSATASKRAQELVKHCDDIGSGLNVQLSNLSEECEREIESEEMKEKEEEIEIPDELPYVEQNWAFKEAFTNAEPLFSAEFFKVDRWIGRQLGRDTGSIRWSSDLYCTANFWNTIRSKRSPQSYLRTVDAFLLFPDGRVVLISEYEVNELLPHWWKLRETAAGYNGVQLQHISLAIRKTGLGRDTSPVPVNVMTSLKLFRGYVEFDCAERKCLEDHFAGLKSRRLIQKILTMRGRLRFLERSDLDLFSLDSDNQALGVPGKLS